MSLYALQKLIYQLNRDPEAQERFRRAPKSLLKGVNLTAEEQAAVEGHDVGLLYVLGVNGQLLMHFAALCGLPWAAYIQAMRDGVSKYGAVRAGLYAMTTSADDKVAGV